MLHRLTRLAVVPATVVLLAACESASASPAASAVPSTTIAQTPASSTPTASPTPASTGHALAAANGSGVGGSVTTSSDAAGTTLTATITGLTPGQQYLVDADPLSCMFFVGGASQSFTKAFTADAGGRATVVWTVPPGMASNANVQALENGRFVAIACTDLR